MLFFELLQIALGNKTLLSVIPSESEWRALYTLCKKQAILGIAYVAIEKLPSEQRPPKQILLQWCLAAEIIKEKNICVNPSVIKISQLFRSDGFPNIILKGQGIAKYYNVNNLSLYRSPGDVDIWLYGSREEIIKYAINKYKDCKIVYHHLDFSKIDDIEIEVHFTPSWMNCYFTNKKLQKFFNDSKCTLFKTELANIYDFPTPSIAFNRVFILIHIYRHLFHEGVGLRQLMDYYFVLYQGFTECEKEETLKILYSLKMRRFVGAVMYIMKFVFGMKDCYLLTTPNEKDGKFLLYEVMRAGNFGHYDKDIRRKKNESDFSFGLRKVKRNLRFVFNYPSEVLWSPIFKLWHYIWRKRQIKNIGHNF